MDQNQGSPNASIAEIRFEGSRVNIFSNRAAAPSYGFRRMELLGMPKANPIPCRLTLALLGCMAFAAAAFSHCLRVFLGYFPAATVTLELLQARDTSDIQSETDKFTTRQLHSQCLRGAFGSLPLSGGHLLTQ